MKQEQKCFIYIQEASVDHIQLHASIPFKGR